MVRKHFVVLEKPDGGVELHRMKPWLRANPQYIPEGMDPTENSAWQLRAALEKQGWRLEILPDRVLVIKPNKKGETSYAEELLEGAEPAEDEADEAAAAEAEEITFGLERDLQSALRKNIDQLETGLKITDGGKERTTEGGRIDITAEDVKGNIVVIELKAGTAMPDVVAQVLDYMGTLAESEKRPVRGILVAGDFHKRVVRASRAISNLELKKYVFHFGFEGVE